MKNEIGSLLTDTGNVLVLSHVTAHPLLGLAGAVNNLGLGFLTGSGKLKLHACLEVAYDDGACDHCGECLSFCPTGAISGKPGETAFDPRTCNRCLGCYMACPRGAVGVHGETIPDFQKCVVDSARAVKDKIRGG